MSPVQYIVIPSWEKFQHYKKPKPKWVKLYRDLLGHYEIMQLTPTERWILVGLWCLAAETDNQIPADLKYLTHRLCAEVTVESLRKLQIHGLLQLPATIQEKSRDDLALVEERRGKQSRGKKRQPSPEQLQAKVIFEYWSQRRSEVVGGRVGMKPTPKRMRAITARCNEGYSVEQIKQAVEGCLSSRFHVTRGFTDIELICRSQEHLERFSGMKGGGTNAEAFGHLA